jgi:hypothetical protein
MLDRETEQQWHVVKESYPDAVAFHEWHGLFFVRGPDLDVLATEFGIESSSPWCGFDQGQAHRYMSQLAASGYTVVRANNGNVTFVMPPPDKRKEIERQRKRGRFLAIEPLLLFSEGDILHATNDRWLTKHSYHGLLDSFKDWLRSADNRSLKQYGELYAYPVADWYEVDDELTSMLESHVLLLAKAAFATGSKLPCKVVEPRPRRNRSGKTGTHKSAAAPEPTALGQARFKGW